MKQKFIELKGEMNPTINVRAIKSSLSIMGRTTRQKITIEIKNLKKSINKLKLTIIYWNILTVEYMFFSSVCGTFSKTHHKDSINSKRLKSY